MIDGIEEGDEAQRQVHHEGDGSKGEGIVDALRLILGLRRQGVATAHFLVFLHLVEEDVYSLRVSCLYVAIEQRENVGDIERMLMFHCLR